MTDKLRAAAQALVDRWDSPQWGGSAENLRHTGEYIAELRVALAEQPAEQNAEHGEPVAWEWRWFDTSPYTVTSWQWSDWKRVEPRNQLCTVEDSLNELRSYIDRGQRYELRALYTAPQPAKRVPLTDEEIAALWLDSISGPLTATKFARAIEAAHGIGEKT